MSGTTGATGASALPLTVIAAPSGILSQYDPPAASPDAAGEAAAAAGSPVEVTAFLAGVELPSGLVMAQPIWYLDDLVPYVEGSLCTTVNLGHAYDYLPDTLSKYLYGTHDLWPLLMELNGVSAREDFVGPTFTVVRGTAVPTLLQVLALARSRARSAAAAAPPVVDLTMVPVPYLGQ